MAGNLIRYTIAAQASGTSKKSLVQITAAGANTPTVIRMLKVSMDGAPSTAVPVLFELEKHSSAGTWGTTNTGVKEFPFAETTQSAVKSSVSAEPSGYTSRVRIQEVPPTIGYQWGSDDPRATPVVRIPGGESWGLAVTAAATVNVAVELLLEE